VSSKIIELVVVTVLCEASIPILDAIRRGEEESQFDPFSNFSICRRDILIEFALLKLKAVNVIMQTRKLP
jgi:hypothetical protein